MEPSRFLKLLSKYVKNKYKYCISDSKLEFLVDEAIVTNTVTNKQHKIYGLVIQVYISNNDVYIYGNRYIYTNAEYNSGYVHSHLQEGISREFKRFCLGSSGIDNIYKIALSECKNNDEECYELYAYKLFLDIENLIRTEDDTGGPYIRIKQIKKYKYTKNNLQELQCKGNYLKKINKFYINKNMIKNEVLTDGVYYYTYKENLTNFSSDIAIQFCNKMLNVVIIDSNEKNLDSIPNPKCINKENYIKIIISNKLIEAVKLIDSYTATNLIDNYNTVGNEIKLIFSQLKNGIVVYSSIASSIDVGLKFNGYIPEIKYIEINYIHISSKNDRKTDIIVKDLNKYVKITEIV